MPINTRFLNELELSKVEQRLGDKEWRVLSGEVYKVKDKNGQIVPFIPNKSQIFYFNNKHNLNVIPKARQLGMSTIVELDFFDDWIINNNFNFGIIADTREIADIIFTDKIMVFRDNLPLVFKKVIKLKSETKNHLTKVLPGGKTGGTISVGTSYRGGTLNRLHISEFGKICKFYPEKAKEIMTGTLQSVPTNGIVTIESTGMGSDGYFFELSNYAKLLEDNNTKLSEMQWKLFFFAWHQDKNYRIEGNYEYDEETNQYLKDLEIEYGLKLDKEQKNFYFLKKSTPALRDNMKAEYPSVFKECFEAGIQGYYYRKFVNIMRFQNRICKVSRDSNLDVYTAWDLGGASGKGDDTSIIFFQIYGKEIRIIDYMEGNATSLIEWCQMLKRKPYKYADDIVPHDIGVTEMSTGISRYQTLIENGRKPLTVPKCGLMEGIDSVRTGFYRLRIDEEKCKLLIKHIDNYSQKRDSVNGRFNGEPSHDEHSHANDSLRYLFIGYNKFLSFDNGNNNSNSFVINYNLDPDSNFKNTYQGSDVFNVNYGL